MSTTTSLMGLKIPQSGDPSPGYVNDIASSLSTLDTHDHSAGKGSPITQSSLSITGPLPMGNQTLQAARSVQFTAQSPILSSPADNGSLFMFGNDLYWLNGANQAVRISAGSAIVGGIGGDYPTTAAIVTYDNPGLQYFFRDSAAALAKINTGAIAANGAINATGAINSNIGITASGNISTSVGGNISAAGQLSGASANISGTATASTVTATGQVNGATASISGNAVVGSLNATGGVLQGSRSLALRGVVTATAATGTTSNPITAYVNGATPAFTQTTVTPPYAGSIAALTARAYGANGTAGTVVLATSGLSVNATTSSFSYTGANSLSTGAAQVFTPGTYTFTAGTNFTINVNTTGWTQTTTGTTGIEVTCWVYC